MVVICLPATALSGSEHERVGTPSTCTVQAPHWAIPQPYLVPIRPITSRSTHSSGVSGSTSTSCESPIDGDARHQPPPDRTRTPKGSNAATISKQMPQFLKSKCGDGPFAATAVGLGATPVGSVRNENAQPQPEFRLRPGVDRMGRRPGAAVPIRHAIAILWFFSGNERMRLPVALKYALSTAGAATQIVGSPMPPQGSLPPDDMHDRFDLRHLGDAHRVVGVEVGLLDAAVLDRALLVEQGGQPVDERARHLPVDLRGVDGVGRIGGADDAVDLDLVAASPRFRRPPPRSRRTPSSARARDRRPAARACPSRCARPPH